MADLLDLAGNRRAARIAELNDALRTTFQGGRIYLTAGIDALADNVKADVLETVRTFSQFDGANDPHREHDFGAFEQHGLTVFWKVDYYSPDLRSGSEDPADPAYTLQLHRIHFELGLQRLTRARRLRDAGRRQRLAPGGRRHLPRPGHLRQPRPARECKNGQAGRSCLP